LALAGCVALSIGIATTGGRQRARPGAKAIGPVARQWPLLTFVIAWLGLATGGLRLIYWISTLPVQCDLTNSSYRTIVSLLVRGAAVVPLFLFPGLPTSDESSVRLRGCRGGSTRLRVL
jgi:hypothetical protein